MFIPGTERPRYLEENVAATRLDLPPEVIARLGSMTVSGDRVSATNPAYAPRTA